MSCSRQEVTGRSIEGHLRAVRRKREIHAVPIPLDPGRVGRLYRDRPRRQVLDEDMRVAVGTTWHKVGRFRLGYNLLAVRRERATLRRSIWIRASVISRTSA